MADSHCLELYFQFKPDNGSGGKSTEYVFLHELNTTSNLAKFEDQITQIIQGDSDVIQEFSVFVDIEKAIASNGKVTLLVVYMLLDIPPEREIEIIHNYENQHLYFFDIYMDTTPARYLMTIELFNISWASNSSDETDAEIYVWNNDEERTSVLNMIYDKRVGKRSCVDDKRTLLQYHSVTFCPHLRFSSKEFSTKFENDTLVLLENGVNIGRFHKFDYEWHNDSFKICLHKYATINSDLITPLLPVNPLSGISGQLVDSRQQLKVVIILWVALRLLTLCLL